MQIDILETPSRYDAFWHFSEKLQEALKRARIDSNLYFVNQPLNRLLGSLRKNPPDATFAFNTTFNVTAKGLQKKGVSIPTFIVFVDWPTYFPPLFDPKIVEDPHFFAGFVDRDCCEFMERQGFKRSFYFPHAIEKEALSDSLMPTLLNSKRDLQILYPASLINPYISIEVWKQCYSRKLFNFLMDSIDQALASNRIPLVTFLEKGLKQDEALQLELTEKKQDFRSLVVSTMTVMRGLDRIHLLSALRDVEVHLFVQPGDDKKWPQLLGRKAQFIFHDAVALSELPQIYQRSKVVLNCMPMFKQGMHERILYALANGATVVTNLNALLPTFFKEGKGVHYFCPPHYEAINEKIDHCLSNEQERIEAALSTRSIISAHHTWDHRVETLIRLLEVINQGS